MEKKDIRLNSQESNDESRRDFLKKAGKMALYTPPAIMLLMHPSRHALACSVRPQKQQRRSGTRIRYRDGQQQGKRPRHRNLLQGSRPRRGGRRRGSQS